MDKEKTKPSDLKLLDRSEVTATLAPTENLEFTDLKPGDNLEVRFHGSKDSPVVDLGGRELRIIPTALQSVAKCCGLPGKFTASCPSDLLFPIFDYNFGEGMKKPSRAITRGDQLISMTADRVRTQVVGNERLLQLAEEKIGREHIVGYHQVYTDLKHSTMAIVTDQNFEPVREDTLFGGIKIQNSIMGQDTIEVSPYVFRQWCSNGAITEKSLGRYTRKKRDNLDNWFHEIIEGASSELDKEFERIRHLPGISVKGHIAEVVNGIAHDKRVSQKITKKVLDEAIESKSETMYDIYNAFTKIASHNTDLSPLAANRLQHVAGIISKEHEICETCHRILN